MLVNLLFSYFHKPSLGCCSWVSYMGVNISKPDDVHRLILTLIFVLTLRKSARSFVLRGAYRFACGFSNETRVNHKRKPKLRDPSSTKRNCTGVHETMDTWIF